MRLASGITMNLLLKILSSFLLLVCFSGLFTYFFWYRTKFNPSVKSAITADKKDINQLKIKAGAIKDFTKNKKYNGDICFLIDMKIASGKKRFFVYDIRNDSVLQAGLVAHGSCDDGFQMFPKFSDKPNSGCSSPGKYSIGKSYYGKFGLAYKLYGLDSSNKHAFERNIVLHSYECIPEQETYPVPVCNSRGCPMVSPGFLKQIKALIDKSKKPILLWVFD